jgi:hypothetical protein
MNVKFIRIVTYVDGNTGEIILNPKFSADDWHTVKVEKKIINKIKKIEIYETRLIKKFATQKICYESN